MFRIGFMLELKMCCKESSGRCYFRTAFDKLPPFNSQNIRLRPLQKLSGDYSPTLA